MSVDLLESYVLVTLLGFAILFLLLLCSVFRAGKQDADAEKLRGKSKRRRRPELRAHDEHRGIGQRFPSPLGRVTGYLEFPRRLVFAVSQLPRCVVYLRSFARFPRRLISLSFSPECGSSIGTAVSRPTAAARLYLNRRWLRRGRSVAPLRFR